MVFTPILSGSGIAGYAYLNRTREDQQERLAQSTQTRQEITDFTSKLDTIQTSEDLMDNRMMLRVALGAFGLDDDLDNPAFIKGILDSDLSDSTSLANRLADKRYLVFAQAFNFQGEDGPKLEGLTSTEKISGELSDLQSVDDLLNNPRLLDAALDAFGLQRDSGNSFLLRQVLLSDPEDARSFANSLDDPAYAEMSRAFDFADKLKDKDSVYGFAETFEGRFQSLTSAEDLLTDTELLTSALKTFGLEGDINRFGFLRDVLNSDTSDDTSFANQLPDERYATLSQAFGFGRPPLPADPETGIVPRQISNAETFVENILSDETRVQSKEDYFTNFGFLLDSMNFFGIPQGDGAVNFLKRTLESDSQDPNSLINAISDKRYLALSNALNLKEPETGRSYPAGFAETLTERYLARQFEIQIGERDPNMRIALSLDRELTEAVQGGLSNDSRWFSVMASRPLRAVFETVFQLPQGFGTLDVDRQLSELKQKSQSLFGTSELADFAAPERIGELRQSFLFQSNLAAGGGFAATSPALTLLSLAGSNGPFG